MECIETKHSKFYFNVHINDSETERMQAFSLIQWYLLEQLKGSLGHFQIT